MGAGETVGPGRAAPPASAAYLTPAHLAWLESEPERGHRRLEGSLLFADVSGFTVLGERLARRGRIGAEQLTDAINLVFGAMHEAIASAGGELVKFGGDAVLALFSADGHEPRAASAALAIQDALGRLPPLGGQKARLRVSAGVASGEADLFLAGAGPRELIVAGPLASLVTALEGEAEAGEVLISRPTAAALPGECAGTPRGDGVLLAGAPPAVEARAPSAPPGADPIPGLPLHLHDHEPADGEHRTVNVGFLQVKGTDELLRRSGPGALADALDEILGAVTEQCRIRGVTLVSTDVDHGACKVILCAGAPVASPDDDDRILHALLAVTERTWPLPVRAGVNRGPAFTGDIGRPERRVWSVMGDTVNLAARVMGKAEPGQVLATRAALARVRDDFTRAAVEPFKVKGKSAPVDARIVGPALGVARAAPAPGAPFVGRREELATLREALDAARAGGKRLAEIVAPPGLGKSRLVSALVEEAADLNLIRIQAGPYGAHTPYLAMRAPFRRLAGIAPDADEETAAARLTAVVAETEPGLAKWLPLIGRPFGVELDPTPETEALAPEFARGRLHGAVAHLLDLVLPVRPTLTVVEDAHWLDDASGELLRHMLTADRGTGPRHGWGADADAGPSSDAGHTAVITRRPVAEGFQLGPIPATRIELEPLAAEDAIALVSGDGDEAIDPATREALLARSEGNPLLLQELVAAVRAGRALDDLPDTVEALMTARIDALPNRERRLVRDAAVLGVHVEVPVLAGLVGEETGPLAPALEPLHGEFFIAKDEETISFRHALLRDAAYRSLSYRRRRELHARAGEAFEERSDEEHFEPELPAIHFHAAGRWRESWRFSRLAGERSMRNAAPVEAVGFFEAALEASRYLREVPRGERAEVAEALGDAADRVGDFDRAAKAYRRARELRSGEALALAGLCVKEGAMRERSRHVTQALRWFTRARSHLGRARGAEAERLRGRLSLAQGIALLRSGRLRQCLPLVEDAVERSQRSGDRATLGHAYYILDWALTDLGEPDHRYRELALPIFEELGDHARQGRVLNNLGVDALYESRWTEAVDYYGRSRDASQRAGDAVEAATAMANLAEIRIDQGGFDEAEGLLRDALGTWRQARFPAGVATALLQLARLATRRGEYERATELFARAREAVEQTGYRSLMAELEAWETELMLFSGRPEEAAAAAERLAETAKDEGAAPAIPAVLERIVGQARLLAGDREAAVEHLRRSAELGAAAQADYSEAFAILELERLGEASSEEAERAVATLARLEVPAGLSPPLLPV